jgi:activator of HSP90 ATPase
MPSIHQEISFAAVPARVYRALLDSTEFAKLTEMPAEIGSEEGESFTCFGTFILGRQIELIADRRIVQAWRVFNWPEGVYSAVRFEFHEENGGTKLIFDQTGVPADALEHVDTGWHEKYWKPLRMYVEG